LNWTKDRLLAYPSGRNYLDNINQKMKEKFIFIWTANEMNKAKTILGGWLSQTHTQGVGNKMLYKYTKKKLTICTK